MSTVTKGLADRIIAGEFAEARPRKIVKYTNIWGGESYGVVFEGDRPDKYADNDSAGYDIQIVIEPSIYWEAPHG